MLTKEGFLSLVKGCIVGITGLIEGISYGSMITALSLHNDAVESINNISKKENKKLHRILLPVILGIILITIASVKLMPVIMDKYKNQAIFLAIGLMLGGYNLLKEKTKEKLNPKKILITVLVIIVITLSQTIMLNNITIKTGDNVIINLTLGALTGITILLPGIKEHFWITLFDKNELLKTSFANIWNLNNFLTISLFVIGAVTTLVLTAKLIYRLMKKYKNQTNLIIKALLLSAIAVAIFELEKFPINFVNIFTTILAFLWGYILVKNLEKE